MALKKSNGRLLTVEDHQTVGGMGSLLCHALLQNCTDFTAKSLGIEGEFGQSAYQAIHLYEKHGLDSKSIAGACQELCARVR